MESQLVDWMRVDWVLLDMDGTLLDLAYDNYFWREYVPQAYASAQGLSVEAARAHLEPHFTSLQHTLPWYCTDHWSRLTGLSMAGLKREIRHRIRALEGTEDFLKALRAAGKQVWLATNAHRDSWSLKLEQTGLAPYFDRIVCSHDFGAPKESPEFWNGLMQRHPFERERALFADDSLPVLRAAQAFGIGQVLAIAHPDSSQPPRTITEFAAVNRLPELMPFSGRQML